MAKIPKDIEKKIARDSSRILKAEFETRIMKNFDMVKNEMVKEFLDHPVTKEILNGPSSDNMSGTLGGNGNLFSYIGFEEDSDPIGKVLEEFRKTSIRFSGLIDNGAVWTIFMPAKEDIWEVSPMPWAAGRSWAKGIETGISGVGQYLYDLRGELPSSRSGTGIQTKSKLRKKSRFKNVKYISMILAKYEQKFSELNETTILT